MLRRIAKNSCRQVARAGAALLLLAASPASAQAPAPLSPARFDPNDVYFQGYLANQSAEKLEAAGDFIGAAEKLQRARELFDAVRRYYPDWKSEMVKGRSEINSEAETRVHPLAQEQLRKNRNVVAELEGGEKNSGELVDPADGLLPLTPGILEIDPLVARRLEEAEAEVQRLQDLAKNAIVPDADPSRNASRLRDMARQRDALQSQLNAAKNSVANLRSSLAAKPVEAERKALENRIKSLEQERAVMGDSVRKSNEEKNRALENVAGLTQELQNLRQKYANLDRDLKAERKVSNEVVAGLRTQLLELQKQLDLKSEQLDQANGTITGLRKELAESRESYGQLRSEMDTLLQERAQMSALLKLNEDGRIQELIEQNMGLAKNLREANERVELLSRDTNAAKDELTAAKRDLSMTKAQINRLHQERKAQDQRLVELENRLKNEQAALESGQASSDPAEVQLLREIIQRQLRVQERRRQARDLLVEAVRDMGSKDERLQKAIELFDAQEIPLSPEEERLIAGHMVDDEFVSPFAQDRATVGRNTAEMKRDIAVYERTAEKSFAAGRYLPTRELFKMIVEQHPGHVPALCKLGVVDLKLDDPLAAADTFRRAVELDTDNPYAHRMLGFSYYMLGDFKAAEQHVKEATVLSPDDAKSLSLLGSIKENLSLYGEAESYYKAAISADPNLSDPYYNLARLCSRDKRTDIARSYYLQALERGALPDLKLEQLVNQP
jgi:hypothetical protein